MGGGGAGSISAKEGSDASHRVLFMSGPQELNAFLSISIKFANIYIRKRKYIEVNIFLKIISIQIRSQFSVDVHLYINPFLGE